jgi:hypothetical protein
MTFSYPPEFSLEVAYRAVPNPVPDGVLVLSCLTCGVSHQFPSGINLETVNEQVAAHINMHFLEAFTSG